MTAPDLTLTAPWAPDTHDLLTRSLSHVVGAQAVMGELVQRRNLITCPSFELDSAGWGVWGTGTIARQASAGSAVGGFYLRCTTDAGSNSGASYTMPGVAGQRYGARAMTRLNAAVECAVRLQFLDSGGAQVGITSGTNVLHPTSAWGLNVVEAVAPAGTVTIRFLANRRLAAPAGQFLDVDAAAVYALDPVQAFNDSYFDGDTAPTALASYRWEGTPHSSVSAEVYPATVIPLDVEEGTLGWDETRAPRVTARLTCRVLDNQGLLDLLDPRTGVRLLVTAGYARPDGSVDSQLLANLGLRERVVTRPDDRMALTGASDEALVIDRSPTTPGPVNAASTTAAMTTVIREVLPAVTPTVTGPTGPAITAVRYSDRWDIVVDLADRISAQVFDDGTRAWFIQPMPVLTTPALVVSTGPGGTVLGSDTGLSREEGWANQVLLAYEWTSATGVVSTVLASRKINSGPYAATAGNTRTLLLEREVQTTQAEADSAAAALVKRTVTRGRSFALETISAYWLRPGHTIEVTLPLGPPEQHLVTAVEFDLSAGSMRVTTRLPDGDYTIGA